MPPTSPSLTLSLAGPVWDRLHARVDRTLGEGGPERLVLDLECYWAFLDYGLAGARRVLTRPEASLILDALKDALFEASQLPYWLGQGLVLTVSEVATRGNLWESWAVDEIALLAKLQGLSEVQRLALVDWAHQFWSRSQGPDLEAATQDFPEA